MAPAQTFACGSKHKHTYRLPVEANISTHTEVWMRGISDAKELFLLALYNLYKSL